MADTQDVVMMFAHINDRCECSGSQTSNKSPGIWSNQAPSSMKDVPTSSMYHINLGMKSAWSSAGMAGHVPSSCRLDNTHRVPMQDPWWNSA